MRRSVPVRLLAALLAVWFVLNIGAEPSGMSGGGMAGMSGMGMSGMSGMAGMQMSGMATQGVATTDMATHDMAMTGMATPPTHAGANESDLASRHTPPVNTNENCKQHDCCCSALSPSLLAPTAALSWVPAHIIDQSTPQVGECIACTEAQLRLPFANGPPSTTSA